MSEEATKADKARQAAEALERVCKAHNIRIMTSKGATVFTDDADGAGLGLFRFDGLGYYPTSEEIAYLP